MDDLGGSGDERGGGSNARSSGPVGLSGSSGSGVRN